MGGGGSYYDRDVPDRRSLTSRGTSVEAEEQMSRRSLDPSVSPKDRKLVCRARSPIGYAFDVTGSMGDLPKFIRDKGPLMAKELTDRQYLVDAAVSLAAVGDVYCDRGPFQVGDFAAVRGLDGWMQKLWLEKGGGDGWRESYEFAAYFYAYCCDFPKAVTPVCLFTGDEGYYETLPAGELRKVFGGQRQEIEAVQVFRDLTAKFRGNVFLLHRRYSGGDAEVLSQWRTVIDDARIIRLKTDKAIMDVTLGIFALASGSRTLDGYCDDMRTRTNATTGKLEPQSAERIAEVRQTLEPLEAYLKARQPEAAPAQPPAKARTGRTTAAKPAPKPAGRKKPGRY